MTALEKELFAFIEASNSVRQGIKKLLKKDLVPAERQRILQKLEEDLVNTAAHAERAKIAGAN